MDHLTTRHTRLQPPQGLDDHRFVHRVLTDPRNSGSFVWHGSTPTVSQLIDELQPALLVAFVVRARTTDRRLGLVLLTNPNLRDAHAFMTAAADPDRKGTGLTIEGLIGLIHLAFISWPFHKLYADVDDVALAAFGSAVGRYLEPEGLFRDHHFRDGRYVDVHRLALYRRTWAAHRNIAETTIGVRLARPRRGGAREDQK